MITQLLSVLNPLLILQQAAVGVVLYYHDKTSFWIAGLPMLVFCGGYGLLCAFSIYKLTVALEDVAELEEEEQKSYALQGRLHLKLVSGFRVVIFAVLLYNIFYFGSIVFM